MTRSRPHFETQNELLAGSVPLGEAVRSVRVAPEAAQLCFVATTTSPADPSGLSKGGFASLLAGIRDALDSIIIDSPPANIIWDASVLGLQADGGLVVTCSGVTQTAALASGTEQRQLVRVPVLGYEWIRGQLQQRESAAREPALAGEALRGA